jgi:hypothetical protein
VPGSRERGPRQRGVSRASSRVQPLHEGVQNGTTTGQARLELPIQAFLEGMSQGCFENRLEHNAEVLQATKRAGFCWTNASQGPHSLPNASQFSKVFSLNKPSPYSHSFYCYWLSIVKYVFSTEKDNPHLDQPTYLLEMEV